MPDPTAIVIPQCENPNRKAAKGFRKGTDKKMDDRNIFLSIIFLSSFAVIVF
ncbi:MAG: hypothetical protein ACLQNE_08170 [Thermoguttaceae bacterium]